MAVPTVSSIFPALVRTAGRTLVEVVGTGFAVHPPAPEDAPLPVPAPNPSIRIEVDGVEADGAEVATADGTRLFFLSPPHAQGKVVVVLQNLDVNGLDVAGEAVSVVDGLEYRRPAITSESRSILVRVTDELIRLFRRDVMDNVRTPPSVDFDRLAEDPENYIDSSELPLLCLFGPDARRDWTRRLPSRVTTRTAGPSATYATRRATRAYDLVYRLIGVTSKKVQLDNLKAVVLDFFQTHGYLDLVRDPVNPGDGETRFEMDLEGGIAQTPTVGTGLGDVRAFNCAFAVLTVDLGGLPGFDDDTVQRRGGTLQEFNLSARDPGPE